MQKYIITITGLNKDESDSIEQLESEYCKVTSSNGFDGGLQEIITIIGDDPIVRAVVVQVIADLLLRIGEDAWNRCKVNFRFPNGRDLINIARDRFEKLKKQVHNKKSDNGTQ